MPNETEDFDVDAFIGASKVSGPLSTQPLMVPEGTYRAQIGDKITGRVINTKDGPRRILGVRWDILDDAARAAIDGRDPFAVQDVWLDLDESGGLDSRPGKNVDLGRIRDAVGQQNDTDWNIGKLRGQMAVIRVTHDPQADGRKFVRVSKVASLSSVQSG